MRKPQAILSGDDRSNTLARGRPHRRQRFRCRTLNFSAFFSRAFFAVVAFAAGYFSPTPDDEDDFSTISMAEMTGTLA